MNSKVALRPSRRVKLGTIAGGAAAAVGALTLAACSGGSPYRTATPMTTTPPAATTSVTIAARSTSLGQIVVDAAGNTLYAFDKDTAGSGSSACNGSCATTWPAATLNGQPSAGPGLTGTLGTLRRTDGTTQVSLDGHPLYRYAGDGAPGDTNGEGIGGIWHVVHVTTAATSANAVPSMGGGY